MNRRKLIGCVVMLSLIAGCEKKGDSSASKITRIKVSGKIASVSGRKAPMRSTSMTCMTLTSTPITGDGIADADGNISVLLEEVSLPFDCFLSTPSSVGAVPLLFNSGATTGSLAVADNDLALGSISVVTNGNGSVVASASLPATATLKTTTPPGLACLAGTWSATSSETCGGSPTTYQLFFTPLPDGTYSNSYVQLNGVTNTIQLTGTTTYGSNCLAVSSTSGLAVGQAITDINSWTRNPSGKGIIPDGTTVSSLTACGADQVQISQTITGGSGPVTDSYLVTVCGTTAHNTKNVTHDAVNSTVSMTYPQACYDVALSHIANGSWATKGAGFRADLTPGSKCLSNLQHPSQSLGTPILVVNYQATDADFSNSYFPTAGNPKIAAIPGSCSAGSFQMSENSSATGTTLLTVYNLPVAAGVNSFMFYGTMVAGSPCVAPVLPGGATLSGYFVADSAGAVTSSSGTGVTLIPAASPCTGTGMLPYMLSEAASPKATAGESFVIVPSNAGMICSLGMCFDANGNAYSGAATCPSGSAALTAQTAVDTYPINGDCSRMWASQSRTCRQAFDVDASLGAHCGAGQDTTNTPVTSVRARYAQTNTGCAACFPPSFGAPSDYPANGCVGNGNVTCTVHDNGNGDSSNIVVIKH